MLNNTFFIIENCIRNENTAVFSVKIDSKHSVFSGHFPGQPVVPGVFTLQMAKECLEIIVENKLQYTEIQNCKFSNAIIPDRISVLQINLDYKITDEILLKATVQSEDITFLTLKAMLKQKESLPE